MGLKNKHLYSLFRSTMDAVQIEIKDEFLHQHQDFQNKNQSVDVSSTGNSNILNEEVHIKNEHNDQENTLIESKNKNTIMDMFCNRCVLQFDKKYVFDLHLKLVHGEKPFNEPEKLEESGIFVKSETDVKPEIIFSLMCGSCHIQNVLIVIEYRNCC